MSEQDVWTLDRLIHYPLITDLDRSPDGRWIAYGLREPVLTEEESKFVNHLYRVSTEGGEPLRLTYGEATHTMPRWSPDGRYLAFLSDRGGDKSDLYCLDAAGGEAWRLTKAEKGIQRFAWSPDGTRLALGMVPPDTEEKKAARKAKDDPVHWGVDVERARLWVLPFARGGGDLPELTPLTGDDRHVGHIAWTDSGDEIVFAHQPRPVVDDWTMAGLAIVSATPEEGAEPGSGVRELGGVPASEAQPAVRGEWAACACATEPPRWTMVQEVRLFPLGGGEPRTLARTPDARPYVLGWSPDGAEVYALEAQGAGSAILALPADGGEPRTLWYGPGYATEVRVNREGHWGAVLQASDRANRVCAGERTDGAIAWREVVDPTPGDWPSEAMPRTERLRWTSDEWEVEGLVTYPLDGDGPHPTLVIVHGGPMSVFSESCVAGPGLYSVAMFAERGYAVLRVNPRGSSGYGPEFRCANVADWGGGDLRDILAGVDLLVERGIADPDRLGIMGWSYGGFMTSWAITQTQRFKAASVGAGVTNLMSMVGTTDIPNLMPDYMGAEYWEDLDVYRRCSAMFQIGNARTPTLIQHGREDARVPLGQGLELYQALKRQGVPVEMYIYPRQQHGPHEPRLIMDIVRGNLAWFDRWVLGKE